ncbi:hypothetical protein AOH443_04360 [Helicobacter pylori]
MRMVGICRVFKECMGANHKGYDAGNAANYLYSQNYQAISVGSGNETGTYSLSGFTKLCWGRSHDQSRQ